LQHMIMEARPLVRVGGVTLGAGVVLWCIGALIPAAEHPAELTRRSHSRHQIVAPALSSYDSSIGAQEPLPTAQQATLEKTTAIFDPDTDLEYAYYRVPALVEHGSFTLAFAQAAGTFERHTPSDIVVKRSTDRGETWTRDLDVIVGNRLGIPGLGRASRHGTEYGNPVPISCLATGEVMLVFSANQTHLFSVSSSDGIRWSAPAEIEGVRVPGWGTLVPGPGHGLELRSGIHAGRLVVPFNHMLSESTVVQTTTYRLSDPDDPRSEPLAVTRYSVENPRAHHSHVGFSHETRMREHVEGQVVDLRIAATPGGSAPTRAGLNAFEARANHAAAMVSDDHGKTWRVGEDIPHLASNEVSMAELPGGELVASFRVRHERDGHCRHFAVSTDGGYSWDLRPQSGASDSPPNCTVVDPGCQGALVSNGRWLYASGPHDLLERRELALYASPDAGEHWKMISRPPAGSRSAGYSDMVVWQPYGVHPWPEIGLAFEQGTQATGTAIMHSRISLGNE